MRQMKTTGPAAAPAGRRAAAAEQGRPIQRADLHVHSRASSKPVIAAAGLIGCPESYSPPELVYDMARQRGMTLITLTDHDTIDGVLELVDRGFEDVVIGEEVTVRFPEDGCALHVLVWNLTPEQHEEIGWMRLRDDVYAFALWLAERRLPHAVAHPLYIQNGKLTRWHLERMALLFKGFEILNGAHSGRHASTLRRWLDDLKPSRIQAMAARHQVDPLWGRAWVKARTAGSDDHAMLNIGRTWTAVRGLAMPDPELFFGMVMAGRCDADGQAGHSALLAHQLITVGMQYYAREVHEKLRPPQRAVGSRVVRLAGIDARAPSGPTLIADAVRRGLLYRGLGREVSLLRAIRDAAGPLLEAHPSIALALADPSRSAGPALGDHETMARFTDSLFEAAARTVGDDVTAALRGGSIGAALDGVVAWGSLAMFQLPHLFSLFHQNKERPFLRELDARLDGGEVSAERAAESLKVMLFTDTLGDVNGVCRFIRNMGECAHERGRQLRIMTSTRLPVPDAPYITNVDPVFAMAMPKYPQLELALPPLMRMLREADAFQPDVIHVSTPGPVGLIGLLASRMLRVPVVGVYHTDFPAYIDHLFDDAVYTRLATDYMRLFYRRFSGILSRSTEYMDALVSYGVDRSRLQRLLPGVALGSFRPEHRDPTVWAEAGIPAEAVKVLYVGRVSVEKNLPLLARVWPEVHRRCGEAGRDARLVVVGDGPYRAEMESRLEGQGAHFLGFRHGAALSAAYASSDLLVFPSATDTLGQVVLEGQASGLPVVVSDQGGPKEVVDEGMTGRILDPEDAAAWTECLVELALDEAQRGRMGRSAATRAARYTIEASFEQFWMVHAESWAAGATEAVESRGAPSGVGRSGVSRPRAGPVG